MNKKAAGLIPGAGLLIIIIAGLFILNIIGFGVLANKLSDPLILGGLGFLILFFLLLRKKS